VTGKTSAGLLFALCLAGDAAAAQDRAPEPGCAVAIVLPAACYRRFDNDVRAVAVADRVPDHRYEGLAIGGGIGLVGGFILGGAICRHTEGPDESCTWPAVRGGLGAGAVLGLLGLLIGGQFPKGEEERVPADSIPRDTVPP
jgi:MFS family permease